MILPTNPKQKKVTDLHITVERYSLEKHDDQNQYKAVNRRLSSHFPRRLQSKAKTVPQTRATSTYIFH
jgi:hypothetical protein